MLYLRDLIPQSSLAAQPARLYIAGAIEFLHAHAFVSWSDYEVDTDNDSKPTEEVQARLTAAIALFERVADLPRDESADRLLWAEYMLGRSYRLRAGPIDLDAAEMHFRRTVELVSAGMPDPMSLQNAALGELGGIALSRKNFGTALELRGTALAPDYAIYAGDYHFGNEDNAPSDIASSDEKRRQEDSSLRPHRRFHYRAVAVEHLLLAANDLPRHSANLAALLCTGAHWLRHHGETPDGELVTKLYHRYQKVGRSAPWDRNFGAKCPEPDFPM